jgi:hypothetical protein
MCAPRSVSKRGGLTIARPRWTVLYAIAAFGLAALAIAEAAAGALLRPALESVIGGAVFLGIALWLRSNCAALDQQDWCECAGQTVTVRVIASRRLAPSRPVVPRVPEPLPPDVHEELWAVGVADR